MKIDPQISILVNGNSHLYQLCGVIYFGGQHFVACLVEQDTTVWYHDGIITGRNMIYEGQLESVDLKHCCDGKTPSALFYTKGCQDQNAGPEAGRQVQPPDLKKRKKDFAEKRGWGGSEEDHTTQ